MYINKTPEQIKEDWQKFLNYNSRALRFSKHCLAQLKKRLPDFYKSHTHQEIFDLIRQGEPKFELYVSQRLRMEVRCEDITFVIDLRSGDIITVLSPEMDSGLSKAGNIKFYLHSKYRHGRNKKRKGRFII